MHLHRRLGVSALSHVFEHYSDDQRSNEKFRQNDENCEKQDGPFLSIELRLQKKVYVHSKC